jgi:hypothetical protein
MQLCGDSRRNLCGLPEFQIVRSVSKMSRVFVLAQNQLWPEQPKSANASSLDAAQPTRGIKRSDWMVSSGVMLSTLVMDESLAKVDLPAAIFPQKKISFARARILVWYT